MAVGPVVVAPPIAMGTVVGMKEVSFTAAAAAAVLVATSMIAMTAVYITDKIIQKQGD